MNQPAQQWPKGLNARVFIQCIPPSVVRQLQYVLWLSWILYFTQATPLVASELATVYKLPAYIQQVTTLGEWQHNGRSGTLRMAITYRKDEYKTFLQWLSQGVVVSTVAVKEVNQGSRYSISEPEFTLTDNQKGILYLKLVERQRENTYKAKIEIKGIGYYQCTFLPGGIVVGVD